VCAIGLEPNAEVIDRDEREQYRSAMQQPSHDLIRWGFAIGNLASAAGIAALLIALPMRYWAIDVPGSLLCALAAASALGLVRQSSWWSRALRVSALSALVFGLAALSALALGVSYLGGVHGELGRMTIGTWIAGSLFLLPYLVLYPALQLLWLHAQSRTA
jgi:hypothetical protein